MRSENLSPNQLRRFLTCRVTQTPWVTQQVVETPCRSSARSLWHDICLRLGEGKTGAEIMGAIIAAGTVIVVAFAVVVWVVWIEMNEAGL